MILPVHEGSGLSGLEWTRLSKAAHLLLPPSAAWRWRCEAGLSVPALLRPLVALNHSCALRAR